MWGCCEPGSGCVEPVAWFELQHDSRWYLYVQKTCLSIRITLFLERRRPRSLSRLSCGCARADRRVDSRERVSVEYGPKRSGHADMSTVLSVSPRLVMDTVATEAGVCRNIETLMYILSDRHAVRARERAICVSISASKLLADTSFCGYCIHGQTWRGV